MSFCLKLVSVLPDYLRDAEEVIRAFFPYVALSDEAEAELCLSADLTDGIFTYSVSFPDFTSAGEKKYTGSFLEQKKYSKRFFKNLIYNALSTVSGVTLPYGSLTGVRPTKLFYELTEAGEDAFGIFLSDFRVAEDKTALVRDTVLAQNAVYDRENRSVDLFVNIPFCPTRCAYCSFLSAEYPKIKKLIPSYIVSVKRELADFAEYLNESKRPLRAVYVGGGTPTALTADELHEILAEVPRPECEYTVEAGRPDTITAAHLDVLEKLGVTRVSVNPQTMSDDVLVNIGRKHTAEQTVAAYFAVAARGFSVNMDFIAGLEGETEASFERGIAQAIALSPDNITVHTLSYKRGAELTEQGAKKGEFGAVSRMVTAARQQITAAGYVPYYLYRQKNMTDNLENTGFTKAGKASYYNVDIMEETTDIFAVGAGAMSKRVTKSENLITRSANPKGLQDYLSRTEEILEKKRKFFSF